MTGMPSVGRTVCYKMRLSNACLPVPSDGAMRPPYLGRSLLVALGMGVLCGLWMQPPELRAQRIGDPSHLATSFCDGIEPTARGGRFDGEVGPVGDCLGPSPPQPTASMRSATNTTAGREFSAPLSQPPTALRNRESSRLCRPVLKPLGNGLVVDIDVASKRSSGQADDSGNVEWS